MGQNYYAYKHNVQVHNPRPNLLIPRQAEYGQRAVPIQFFRTHGTGQYPQLVPIKVFGRLAEQASAWKTGSVLSVSGRLGGRDWQGKVYGDIVANTVEVVSEGAKDGGGPDDGEPPHNTEDVPF